VSLRTFCRAWKAIADRLEQPSSVLGDLGLNHLGAQRL